MEVYTDGATSNNGYDNSYGGWAYVIVENDQITMKGMGNLTNTTNNICELTAIIKGCQAATDRTSDESLITVYSDSAYIINCYKQKWYEKWQNNGWINSKRQPVANKDLWLQLIPFFQNSRFCFEKVKAHTDNYYNNLVDAMAVEAKKEKN